jgi:hypothetical protein
MVDSAEHSASPVHWNRYDHIRTRESAFSERVNDLHPEFTTERDAHISPSSLLDRWNPLR